MLEVKSYENILNTYLKRLPEGIDRREGTLAYIVGSAVSMELAELYERMKLVEDNMFVDTAYGRDLEKAVSLLKITRRKSTNAIVRMEGDANFAVGDIFTNGSMEYRIIQKESGYYLAKCNISGKNGNSYTGEVIPKGYEGSFAGMSIVSIVALGEDTEDDESLKKRYIERLNYPMCTGNLSYYREVINSIEGVGGIRVVPTPEGAGTVKVIITDSEFKEANDDLVRYVKNLLDPEETSGQGYGLVPIGHKVSVESVKKVDIDIVMEVDGQAEHTAFYRTARSRLPWVFREINKDWDLSEQIVLWDRVIEDYFFGIGAKDVNVISINNNRNRFVLKPNEILGGVTINGA